MKKFPFLICFLVIITGFSIQGTAFAQGAGPVKVEVRETEQGFQLYRGGDPYYIKGGGGHVHLDVLAECGGNSIRTWSADGAEWVLNEAHKRGLTVTLGFWMGHERHGFDYNDQWAVQGQFTKFKDAVKRLKDHPALLMWGIGNEMDLFYTNFNVWPAVQQIAKMCHELDPNHPTMVVTAGIDVADTQMIRDQCPDIDIIGINTYGDLPTVPEKIRQYGWDRPYIITEWGPNGWWESPKTEWKAAREASSQEKSDLYAQRYTDYIENDTELCLGSYVFLWGHKQETTPTWFGLFLKDGTPTATVDVMAKAWKGEWPANRAAKVTGMEVNSTDWKQDIYLKPKETYSATVRAVDPENKPLRVVWQFIPESTNTKTGGDFEVAPEPIEGLIQSQEGNSLTFTAPTAPGAYRIFVYVYDDSGKVGTLNTPVFVKK